VGFDVLLHVGPVRYETRRDERGVSVCGGACPSSKFCKVSALFEIQLSFPMEAKNMIGQLLKEFYDNTLLSLCPISETFSMSAH
jgi:hypothetical protein